MGSLHVRATLVPRGPAAAFILDDEQVAIVGEGAKRFPVVATIDGHPFRLSVARMGGEFMLGLRREVREQAGVQAGDTVDLRVELDRGPREVEVPAALGAALAADPEAKGRFDRLAFTHRKEFARWVQEARRDATRDRRVAQAVEMIRAGTTRS
jgi:hypothetical protein